MTHKIPLIGVALGIGAGNTGTMNGPMFLKERMSLPEGLSWKEILFSKAAHTPDEKLESIHETVEKLAQSVHETVTKDGFFTVFGGDHSCAIGTWSGASCAYKEDIGLIWFDAHCDAHTHDTSHTGNIHGMPLAALLGYGNEKLTHILEEHPKLKPENVVMIGIRDYEKEEHEFLISKGVKIFYNTETNQQGIIKTFSQAIDYLSQRVNHFGLTFDLDGLDPTTIPAVGTPVPDGIDSEECLEALTQVFSDKRLIGCEIVEFNPELDQDQLTEKYVKRLLDCLVTERQGLQSN